MKEKSRDYAPLQAVHPVHVGAAGDENPDQVGGLSVVVPIYNEIGNIDRLYAELTAALTPIGKPFEIILVDDGSKDGSAAALEAIAATDQRVKLIFFRRNYGQTAAMKAGIDAASMDVVITIDGDLQNDPADIGPMIAKLEQGYDLVHGWRVHRQDAMISRKLPSRIANWIISRTTRFPIHDLGCTLKAIRRNILSEVELYGDMHRFIPILLHQRGARCFEIETHHRQRIAGVTKYGIGRTLVVLLDLLTVKYLLEYSAHPMRLFGGLGLASFGVAVLTLVVLVLMKVIGGVDMTGNPFLMLSVVSWLAGLQLLSLGLIGEILARIYFTTEKKTHYAVRRTVNFEDAVSAGVQA
ncbi:glycosyltransferase family 2 protein [Rhodobacter ferrooxidans]|uniref:glycosyltransferase family 2 protein n=1 Tax=Rhodobacter ferrooxidans TaxID=371731 RepID=UPI0018DE1D05|nr:glycosyltransferase family 2 protein [Rhodobacter sp. SW2]